MAQQMSEAAVKAILECVESCKDCPATDHCTPDCVVNVNEQLMADMHHVAAFVRAIDAELRMYYNMTGDDAAAISIGRIARLVKEILPRLPKEES